MKVLSLKNILLFLAGAGILLVTGCNGIIDPGAQQDIDGAIRSMSSFHQPAERETPLIIGPIAADDPTYPDRPDDFTGVQTKAYKVFDAPRYDELTLLDPKADVFWLGSILDGNSITTGEYRPITTDRGPLTFSINIPMGLQRCTVPAASLSSVQVATGKIVTSDMLAGAPADIRFTKEFVYSKEQSQLAIGVNLSGWGASLKMMFDFSNTQERSRMLVKFQQIYYTLSIDIPQDPSDFFAPHVTWKDLMHQIGGDVAPVYISSIKYGRMAIFAIESDYSESEVKAAVDFAYNGWGIDAGAGVRARDVLASSSTTINARIYGGNGESGVKAINGYDSFVEWLEGGGDFSKESPGAPLAYTMRYLKDNSVAYVVLASEYWMRKAGEEAPPIYPTFSMIQLSNAEMKNAAGGGNYIFNSNLILSVTLEKGYDDYGISGSINTTLSQLWIDIANIPVKQSINRFVYFNEGIPLAKAYVVLTVKPKFDSYYNSVEYFYNFSTFTKKIYLSEFCDSPQMTFSIPFPEENVQLNPSGILIVNNGFYSTSAKVTIAALK